MPWNHRIQRRVYVDKAGNTTVQYGIVEAFYKERGDKLPHSWTEDFMAPSGETVAELTKEIAYMLAALRLPILNHNGGEVEPATLTADEIQLWVDELADVKGEA